MVNSMKKGQVTVWIIIAVILLASILLFLFLRNERTEPGIVIQGSEFSPEQFLTQCTSGYVDEVTSIILPQGGLVSPLNYRQFDSVNVEYLCENVGFYEPCINQHPVLMQEIKKQIDEYVTPRIDNCFNELKVEMEKRGAGVVLDVGEPEVEIKLGEDRIFVTIDKGLTIEELGNTRVFEQFEVEVTNPTYNLAMIAMEIAAQEADYCYFEYVGYRILYPRYIVRPYVLSDPTKIYKITDTKSGRFMQIAIRSCAIPAGF